MNDASLTIWRWLHVGAAVNALTLSGDGRHLLAGSEHDLRLLDRQGNVLFRYFTPPEAGATHERDMPFSVVAMTADMDVVLAGRRTGELHRLEMVWSEQEPDVWPQTIRIEANDLYNVTLAAETGLLAIGHLGPALTVLDVSGLQQWRRHPDDRNPTNGKTWAVAFSSDGQTLYAGSSGGSRYVLAALDAHSGESKASRRMAERVTLLTCLPDPLAVVAILNQSNRRSLAAFEPDLGDPVWEHLAEVDEFFTALASDHANNLVAVGTNAGSILLFDAPTGRLLIRSDELESAVLSLAVSDGQYIAAGLQDGQIAYMEYTPAIEEVDL